jgi:hypothetical protein
MIPKSVNQFSGKIMRKQKNTMRAFKFKPDMA